MKHLYTILFTIMTLLTPLTASAYSLDPASGSSMNAIENVSLTYDYILSGIDVNKVYVINNETQATTLCRSFEMDYSDFSMKKGTLKFPKITEGGEYTLVLEQGAVKCWFDTDPTNQEITASYTVDPNMAATTVFSRYTLYPDPAKTLMSLSQIWIRFTDIGYYDTVTADKEVWKNCTLTCSNDTYYCVEFSGSSGDWYLGFNIDPTATESESITKSGEYLLTLPAGSLSMGTGDDKVLNQEIKATFTIDEELEFTYASKPASGTENILPKSGDVSIQFTIGEPASELKADQAIAGAEWIVKLNDKVLKRDDSLASDAAYAVTYYGVTVNVKIPRSAITESSEIHITAAKGAFTVNELPSPSIDYTVTYIPPKEFTYFFTPADNKPVKPFKQIVVTFSNATSVEKPYYCRDTDAKLISENQSQINSTKISVSNSGSFPTMTISFAEEIPDGTYSFSFPKGNLILDKEDSPLLSTTFIIDSNASDFEGLEPPYSETFDTVESLAEFTIINANGDLKAGTDNVEQTWEWSETAMNGSQLQEVSVSGDSKDDWLISPALKLDAGKIYKVALHARASGFWNESFEVKAGDRPAAEAMVVDIIPSMILKGASDESDFFGYFTPATTGDYNIGIHANTVSGGWLLFIDNLEVSGAISEKAPAAVTELTLSTDPDNNRNAVISMKAPAKNIGGADLTSIDKITVSRDGTVVKTFETPVPGDILKYVDTVDEAGVYSYTVTPFASAAEGISSVVKNFIGTAKASSPTNVKAVETENMGTVTISWDAPLTDINGDPINPDYITYYIEKRQVAGGEMTQTLLKRFVTGNSYTAMIVNPSDKQEFYSFGVYAETDGGISDGAESKLIPLGKPFSLPYSESFTPDSENLIAMIPVNGENQWEIMSDNEGKVQAADNDNAFAGLNSETSGDSSLIYTGKIDLTKAFAPELSYYVYNFGKTNGTGYDNELDVMINAGDDFKSVNHYIIGAECEDNPGWYQKVIDLSDFNGKEIQVGILGTIRNHGEIFIDALEIHDKGAYVDNIAVGGASVTASPGYINISNPVGLNYAVYTVSGEVMCDSNRKSATIAVAPGIYIVKLGQSTLKISVK